MLNFELEQYKNPFIIKAAFIFVFIKHHINPGLL